MQMHKHIKHAHVRAQAHMHTSTYTHTHIHAQAQEQVQHTHAHMQIHLKKGQMVSLPNKHITHSLLSLTTYRCRKTEAKHRLDFRS